MTEALLVVTTPVFEVDGQVRGELARDLLQLAIEETTEGLKTLTARFLAQGPQPGRAQEGLLYLDGGVLDFGKRLDLSIGAGDQARAVFHGVISGIEVVHTVIKEPEVVMFAEDHLMKLRMTRRMKTYERVTDAQIAEAIAAEHGLSADVDADGPTYDVVQQWNMSDLAFLRERARLIQAELWVQDETLCFKSRETRHATSLVLVLGNHLLAARIRADLAHQRTQVKISGYDAQTRDGIDEEAGAETILEEVSEGRTGPAILEQVFGERGSFRVREVPLVGAEARAWARAEMLRRARAFVTVNGVTRGTPDMVVGSRLSLERVGGPFEGGGYYVTRVCHTYDLQDGYRTHFAAERAVVEGGG